MNFPAWLAKGMRTLPLSLCGSCGRPVLAADLEDPESDVVCLCPYPSIKGYLSEQEGEGDGPSVAWTPALPKDQKIEADGKGGIVFYKRSRSTYRMVPVKRVAPWTEVTP